MFIDDKTIIKLMKRDYKKAGVTISDRGDSYYIQGGRWAVMVLKTAIPNNVKGTIVELFGRMPKLETVRARKEEKEPYACEYSIDLINYWTKTKGLMDVLPVHLHCNDISYGLLQSKITGNILLVSDELLALVNESKINLEIEGMPVGPVQFESLVMWKNATGILALTSSMVDSEYIEILEQHAKGVEEYE